MMRDMDRNSRNTELLGQFVMELQSMPACHDGLKPEWMTSMALFQDVTLDKRYHIIQVIYCGRLQLNRRLAELGILQIRKMKKTDNLANASSSFKIQTFV